MDKTQTTCPAAAAAFRVHALAQPHAMEQPHFQAVSFRVATRIFAQLSANGLTGLVKLPLPEQHWAVSEHPACCAVEPHWGKHGWTRLTLSELPHELMRDLISTSWRMVAPKKLHPP